MAETKTPEQAPAKDEQPQQLPPGQRGVDAGRVIEKLQADPTGALLVRNAAQACLIEDQEELIAGLRAELVAATSAKAGRTGGSS